MAATQQVSLRMPADLIEDIQRHGDRTSYILQAVREKIKRDEEAEFAAGLLNLVDDPENDISDFAEGQAKVATLND